MPAPWSADSPGAGPGHSLWQAKHGSPGPEEGFGLSLGVEVGLGAHTAATVEGFEPRLLGLEESDLDWTPVLLNARVV